MVTFDAELKSLSNVYFYDVDNGSPIVRVRLHKRERERVECVVNDLNIIKVDQNITNDLSRTSERVETNSLFITSYETTNQVVFSQQISLVEAFFQNMEKRCDWLRISQANLFRLSSGKKESALWDEYI